MQALILAAGLGTRLKPLTDHTPKALVAVQGQPLLKIAIDNLVRQGITQIVVNIHHHADQVCQYLLSQQWEVPVLISDEREMLLDTGGGVKKADRLFSRNEAILIHNVDILSHINLSLLHDSHTDSMSLATLVVSERATTRHLLFDQDGQLTGWRNHQTNETRWADAPCEHACELAFDGIALVEPSLVEMLPDADRPYSIIPAYLNIARTHRINYFKLNPNDWIDIGTPQKFAAAQQWKLS